MSDVVISVEGLSKSYLIGHDGPQERYHSLRDTLVRHGKNYVRKAVDMARGRQIIQGDSVEEFWALKDVSFEVKRGEVLGIIGRNGAGKSTLLRVLSRITEPTAGRVVLDGRVASLLEVGTGFHPELTGRENIFLNGAILGMTKVEIRQKFDEIVDFAGVEKFLDTPVKRYSSGMYVRLAFAVAAHLEPEILIIDEVLAVGDAEFQKKCLGKMQDVAKGGRTVLFVSHQLAQVRQLCSSVIWLDAGQVEEKGTVKSVVSNYEAVGFSSSASNRHGKHYPLQFVGWGIVDSSGNSGHVYDGVGEIEVLAQLIVNRPIKHGHHTVGLYLDSSLIWGMEIQNFSLAVGSASLGYKLPHLPIQPGIYEWKWHFFDENGIIDSLVSFPPMHVQSAPALKTRAEWTGILNLPCEFVATSQDIA